MALHVYISLINIKEDCEESLSSFRLSPHGRICRIGKIFIDLRETIKYPKENIEANCVTICNL